MKLLNHTSTYFAAILLVLMAIWAGLFYYAMLDEIYDSIDDGLDNQKGLIIQKAAQDPSILHRNNFEENDYAIHEIPAIGTIYKRDVYLDTMMYMQNEEDYEPVRLLRSVFSQGGKLYQVDVVTSMVEEDDLVRELLEGLVWLYIGLVASILILNNFLLRRIWRPFYHLLHQLRRFRLEKAVPPEEPSTRVHEFQELNQTVSNLLESNIAIYNSQKQFIENAAHELQTPLAIASAKLEALAQKSQLTEEEGALLSSAIDHVQRMARLNRSLLLLSKIENKQFGVGQPVPISDVARQVLQDFREMAEYKAVQLRFTESGAPVVLIDEGLARILLTNLIKNAVVHNNRNGDVHITTGPNSLLVENTGAAAALDSATLFTRFNRGEGASHSTGLGLAIAKAISDLYGFNLTYSYAAGRHSMKLRF